MIEPSLTRREPNPWTLACVTLIVTLISFALIGPFIGLAVAYPFYDGKPLDFISDITDPFGNEQMKSLLLIVQGCTTFFGLAVLPALFWKAMTHNPVMSLFKGPRIKPLDFVIIIGIVIFFMGFNSLMAAWNANLDLPDGAFETWAKDIEQRAAELTKYMTSFTNTGQYIAGVFVIAVLAGLGEELVFRGLLQPAMHKATGNIHFAIWMSAIFFSALHLQFYGFVPRVLLGALFGYLYYWSGNLIVPMFAHFINNFVAITVIYLGVGDLTGMEGDNIEALPWYLVIIYTIFCGLLIYQFRAGKSNTALPNDVSA